VVDVEKFHPIANPMKKKSPTVSGGRGTAKGYVNKQEGFALQRWEMGTRSTMLRITNISKRQSMVGQEDG
jgi:hypothetical protein